MPAHRPLISHFPCTASLLAALSAALFATAALGAAIVGQTRENAADAAPASDIDAIRSSFRRPTSIPFPATNNYTARKVALGKALFFDNRLSLTSTRACATCHNPSLAWSDGQPVVPSLDNATPSRRSPTVLNTAWSEALMWDGRSATLEDQAMGPIQSPSEMNMPIDLLLERLSSVAGYRTLFNATFSNEGMTADTISRALASYQRTLMSGYAPFDAWVDGDADALSESAKRGFAIFNTKGRCASCHEGWNLTNDGFQDIGLPSTDPGRGRFLPRVIKMRHAFKTPGLRDIARRAPYMHDGSIATLEAVVAHYDSGGIDRPSRSDLIAPLGLTSQEKADLVSFLKSLSGAPTATALPVLPQ